MNQSIVGVTLLSIAIAIGGCLPVHAPDLSTPIASATPTTGPTQPASPTIVRPLTTNGQAPTSIAYSAAATMVAEETNPIVDLTVHPSGDRVAYVVESSRFSGPAGYHLRIRTLPSGALIRELAAAGYRAVTWSPSGQYLAATTVGGRIDLLSIEGEPLREVEVDRRAGSPQPGTAVWSADGRQMAFVGVSGGLGVPGTAPAPATTPVVVDLTTGSTRALAQVPPAGSYFRLFWSADGRRLWYSLALVTECGVGWIDLTSGQQSRFGWRVDSCHVVPSPIDSGVAGNARFSESPDGYEAYLGPFTPQRPNSPLRREPRRTIWTMVEGQPFPDLTGLLFLGGVQAEQIHLLGWSSPRQLLVGQIPAGLAPQLRMWSVEPVTGRQSPVAVVPGGVTEPPPVLTPDGRIALVVAGQGGQPAPGDGYSPPGAAGTRGPAGFQIWRVEVPSAGSLRRVTETGSCLNLRPVPSTSATALACLADGTVVADLNEQRAAEGIRWRKVKAPIGGIGWVSEQFLAR